MADISLLEPLISSVDYYGNAVFDDYPNIKVTTNEMDIFSVTVLCKT